MEKFRFYYDKKFLGSKAGRPLRILSEYLSPLSTIQRNKIRDTIVFFGSARIQNNKDEKINEYYQKAKELSYKLTKWNMKNYKKNNRFIITSGAGPGIMAAANQGATEAGGKTIAVPIVEGKILYAY